MRRGRRGPDTAPVPLSRAAPGRFHVGDDLDATGWDARVRRLYEYWLALREKTGRLPRRADFDPLDVWDIVPWIWMVDVTHDPLRFRFRLMGTMHSETIGREVTGQWIDEAFPGFERAATYGDYLQVATELRPSYRKGRSDYHVSFKMIERIMLPLVDEGGRCTIILAITVYD